MTATIANSSTAADFQAHQHMPPQYGWSPKKGTIAVGMPAAVLAAVVPAPPWCTAAAQRGNSHPCGTVSTTCTCGDCTAAPSITPRPPQPAHSHWLSADLSAKLVSVCWAWHGPQSGYDSPVS